MKYFTITFLFHPKNINKKYENKINLIYTGKTLLGIACERSNFTIIEKITSLPLGKKYLKIPSKKKFPLFYLLSQITFGAKNILNDGPPIQNGNFSVTSQTETTTMNFHSIVAMPEYSNYSFEEMRFNDYVNRKLLEVKENEKYILKIDYLMALGANLNDQV